MLEIRSSYPLEENEQITRLSINVNRYWAATGWAIAAYILTIIIISLFTWMYFNRKLQKRQVYKAKEVKLKEKLEEETEIRKEEEKTTNCVTKSDICWHRNYALRYHSSLLR